MKRKHVFWTALFSIVVGLISAARADDAALTRWIDAVGGEQRLSDVEVTHLRYKAKMLGLEGELDQWTSADGRLYQYLDLAGLFKVTSVFVGKTGWVVDQNGKLSEMAGEDLKNTITSAYVESWSNLLPGRMPGLTEQVGIEEDTGDIMIRCRPEGGSEITFFIDPATDLPVRMEQPLDDRTQIVTFAEWKPFDGILLPTRVRQTTGDAQYDYAFELVAAEFNVTPPNDVFAKPSEAFDDVHFVGSSPAELPFEMNTVHIFVQASVNGSERLWFIFDTGASVSALNTTTAQQMGLELKGKIEGRGAGEGSVEANVVSGVTFALPGVELTDQTSITVPLDDIEPLMGRAVDGILGYDLISRFVVVIDYQNKVILLHDPASFTYEGAGVRIPIALDGNVPMVNASVVPFGGTPIEGTFLVDTGANSAVIFGGPFTDRYDLLATLPRSYEFVGGYGIGGESRSVAGRTAAFELGGLRFEEPICGFALDEGGALANPAIAGIIGGQILRRCTVTFDYGSGEMILEPNDYFDKPFREDLSGLVVTSGGRGDWASFTVLRVRPNSPAANAGIREGDVILAIDGKPANEFTIHSVREYFENDGTVELTLERDGEKFDKAMKLTTSL